MDNELKPCPFCGGKIHIEKYRPSFSFENHYRIFHTCKREKGSLLPQFNMQSNGYRTLEEAIESVNRRVSADDHK